MAASFVWMGETREPGLSLETYMERAWYPVDFMYGYTKSNLDSVKRRIEPDPTVERPAPKPLGHDPRLDVDVH